MLHTGRCKEVCSNIRYLCGLNNKLFVSNIRILNAHRDMVYNCLVNSLNITHSDLYRIIHIRM